MPEMYETVRTVCTYCGTYKKYLVAYFFMRIGWWFVRSVVRSVGRVATSRLVRTATVRSVVRAVASSSSFSFSSSSGVGRVRHRTIA